MGCWSIGTCIGADARKAVVDFREVQLMTTHPVPDVNYGDII